MKKDKKIIFLDIDGVLQPYNNQFRFDCNMDVLQECMAREHQSPLYMDIHKYDLAAAYCDWDEDAVEYLRSLLEKTDAQIVISSDWRSFNDTPKMKLLFKIYGMDEYVIDVTSEELKYCYRDGEIADYLFHHPDVTQFVILDDRYSDDFGARYPDNFVHTHDRLEPKDIEKSLEILNRPPSDEKLNNFKMHLEQIRNNDPNLTKSEIFLEHYSLLRQHLQISREETLDIIFADIAGNTHLTELCISKLSHDFRASLGKNTGEIIDEKLGIVLAENKSIKRLTLKNSFNDISNILEALKKRSTPLEYFDLAGNSLYDNGMKKLAEFIDTIDYSLKINLIGALHKVNYELYKALKKNLNVIPQLRYFQVPLMSGAKMPEHFDMLKERLF
ncbi:hypothetical protein MHK_010081 [Candidatus Magnetomorum sp. HK-1]|nr:hypothetical protein MHK_010081 [Candidatus Magnetomorum sp. HK-1]